MQLLSRVYKSFRRNRKQSLFAESKSRLLVTYLPFRKVPIVEMVPRITCYCARPYTRRVMEARSQNASQSHPEGCWLVGFVWVNERCQAQYPWFIQVSHLKVSCLSLAVRVRGGYRGCPAFGGGRSARQGLIPTSSYLYPEERLIRDPYCRLKKRDMASGDRISGGVWYKNPTSGQLICFKTDVRAHILSYKLRKPYMGGFCGRSAA